MTSEKPQYYRYALYDHKTNVIKRYAMLTQTKKNILNDAFNSQRSPLSWVSPAMARSLKDSHWTCSDGS